MVWNCCQVVSCSRAARLGVCDSLQVAAMAQRENNRRLQEDSSTGEASGGLERPWQHKQRRGQTNFPGSVGGQTAIKQRVRQLIQAIAARRRISTSLRQQKT